MLTFYCANKPVTVQCDASTYSLDPCLPQEGQPIAYVSRSLTSTERNYAQIEKELLALCFSMERFHHYVYGRKVTVQSDHKPLKSIIKNPIYKASHRLQLMLLRLMKYTVNIIFTPNKPRTSPLISTSSRGDGPSRSGTARWRYAITGPYATKYMRRKVSCLLVINCLF